MGDQMNSETLKQDIVTHGDKQFFVSTINRESSAELSYRQIYAETLVWEWHADREGNDERGKIVGQDEAAKDSLLGHNRMCKQFTEHGKESDEQG